MKSLPFVQSKERKLVTHVEDPMDWDDEDYQDRKNYRKICSRIS